MIKNSIFCDTAHAAFLKACDSFKIKKVLIPCDKSGRIDIGKTRKAINRNTCGIVVSFPSFPHGIEDDVETISDIGYKNDIPVHVDCCLGGFLVCFYDEAKINFPKFKFSLKGVTKISADYHKFGMACKGISLVMWRSKELRSYLYFNYNNTKSGFDISPSYNGSRTPAYAVSAYTVILNMGKDKMIKQAREIHIAVVKIADYIRKEIPELEVLGDPRICVFAFKGDNIMRISQYMNKTKHWHCSLTCNPVAIHYTITSANLKSLNQSFCTDLKEAVEYVANNPNEKLGDFTEFYGTSLSLPEDLVRKNLDVFIDTMIDY